MTIYDPEGLVPAASVDTAPALLATDLEKAASLARQSKAAATRRAYGADFQIFGRCAPVAA
jgi:hypothetical protein